MHVATSAAFDCNAALNNFFRAWPGTPRRRHGSSPDPRRLETLSFCAALVVFCFVCCFAVDVRTAWSNMEQLWLRKFVFTGT